MFELNAVICIKDYTFFLRSFKETVSVIYVTSNAKMAVPDSQRYPSNLYLLNNKGDILVYLNLKIFKLYIFPAVEMRKVLL